MHKMAVADVTYFPNWYCKQWLHTYGSQKSDRFGFSAVCLHFDKNSSAIKTKSPQ